VSSEPKIRLTEDGAGGPVPEGTSGMITVQVERRVPEGDVVTSRTQTYELHPSNALNILGVFREIYFHHDPSFGFRNFECGRGICSTCNVTYEGRVQKGCRIPVPAGSTIHIGPQWPDRALRDIACTIGEETDAEEEE
jgi:succinate dehydrogenase/fumarate reductase-like Fe-S protein